jgi:hypothetical protein
LSICMEIWNISSMPLTISSIVLSFFYNPTRSNIH